MAEPLRDWALKSDLVHSNLNSTEYQPTSGKLPYPQVLKFPHLKTGIKTAPTSEVLKIK